MIRQKSHSGIPGTAISTGVKGKKSLVPTSSTLDHDMTKASLTPSVILKCKVPESADKSFVSGTVFVAVNDSVFQTSSPFQHAAMMTKVLESPAPVLLKFTDGGTDQRNTLEAVKCANICLFKELNLDMLIHGRCAPGQSWTNPAERVMSILNLGLQNVSLERIELESAVERILAQEKPEIKESWKESVEPVHSVVRNRLIRLKLKDEPIQVVDPVLDDSIDVLKRHLRELFPQLDLQKLQKVHTKKVADYVSWIEKHCKMIHYVFQIRKCSDRNCCLEPSLSAEKLQWLPDPVLEEDGNHCKKYNDVKNQDTTEKDRPSLRQAKEKPVKRNKRNETVGINETDTNQNANQSTESTPVLIEDNMLTSDPSLYTVQNARSVCECIGCAKPRVVYSHHRLTEWQQISLIVAMSEYEYTCGSALLPPSTQLCDKVVCKSNLTCSMPVELAYYSS
ncbi:unnamed protein product [Mytilus coruscus]|uniref:Uncharacterized protein n=1 Tax=Mytilus coruscus TaxID=42192 RepID=A0A6J8DI64_MYTCO|nr:unnamed protein product [Mytilus coruscus]